MTHPATHLGSRARSASAGLLLLFPEITFGLLLFDAVRHGMQQRFDGQDPERGDVIQ